MAVAEHGGAWFKIMTETMGMPEDWIAGQLDVPLSEVMGWKDGKKAPAKAVALVEKWRDIFDNYVSAFMRQTEAEYGTASYDDEDDIDIPEGLVFEQLVERPDGGEWLLREVNEMVPVSIGLALRGHIAMFAWVTMGMDSVFSWTTKN